MHINTLAEFNELELIIASNLKKLTLDSVLTELRLVPEHIEPFIIASTASFALRYCHAGKRAAKYQGLKWESFRYIIDLVTTYQLCDPITFDKSMKQAFRDENPISLMLRIAASQLPYKVSIYARHTQPLMLFNKMPKKLSARHGIPKFDFDTQFEKLTGVQFLDFLLVGFIAFVAAQKHHGFSRSYFEKARNQGIKVPQEAELLLILDRLAGDPIKMRRMYQQRRESDRRFASYDFNPLFVYPIIRPWSYRKSIRVNQDYMTAPLPNLIAAKISTGIYYEMFNAYGVSFSQYFGYLFEEYVGEILRHSVPKPQLFSEDDIRKTYPSQNGKVPDWIVVDGDTVFLIECKATRFSRAAVTKANDAAINDSLRQVLKGIEQAHNFKTACIQKKKGLERFHQYNRFVSVVVTSETLYLINSTFFRDYVSGILDSDISNNWKILSVKELEYLQPCNTLAL